MSPKRISHLLQMTELGFDLKIIRIDEELMCVEVEVMIDLTGLSHSLD